MREVPTRSTTIRIVVRPYDDAMALADELERIAAFCRVRVRYIAAEAHPGDRIYVCSFEEADGGRTWLAYDGGSEPARRNGLRVLDAVSIITLCELAAETAAGGDLDELRSQLAALRVTEDPGGIQKAEEDSLELQHVLGAPPRLPDTGPARRDRQLRLGSSRSRSGAQCTVSPFRRGDEGRRTMIPRPSSARWSAPTGSTLR